MRTIKQEHFFPLLILIHFIFWWIDLLLYKGNYQYNSQHIAGEVFSSWVVTVFATNFVMATRARWVERIFGGLDKMYMIHRRAGVIAVVLLLFHFIIVPRDPIYTIGKPLGFYALILIIIGVILSAAPVFKRKIKYHKWVNMHKIMGIAYILGIAHSFNVPTLTFELPIVRTYVVIMALIGIMAWFYKAFLYNVFNKKLNYTVEGVTHFNNDIVEVVLNPVNKELKYNAGQFAFVSFDGVNSKEFHPYTISSNPKSKKIRFTIKSLGDYTSAIQSSLKNGTTVKLQGPYGLFDYKRANNKKQIWLAGGIGITPFLSFISDIKADYEATLIWSVKTEEQAIYKSEIEEIAKANSNIKFILWNSDQKGHFSIDKIFNTSDIKNNSVLICGSDIMREAYIKQLLEKGMSIKDIYYEEFSFR